MLYSKLTKKLKRETVLHLNLNVRPKTARRLKKVLEYSRDGESFAQNVIAYQVTELKRAILNLRVDLRSFEKRYRLKSADFYKKFDAGKLDDREDYMLWAGLWEMLEKNEKKLQELEG